jgi:hypothetical protein
MRSRGVPAAPTPAQIVRPTAATIENATTGTGHGEWKFAGDAGPNIPGAVAGIRQRATP